MTDRERNAWIAEHVMGWVPADPHNANSATWFTGREDYGGLFFCLDKYDESNFRCFSFVDDLNLCFEAEAKIAPWQQKALYPYLHELEKIVLGYSVYDDRPDAEAELALIMATARQRCEAMYAIREKIEKERKSV